MLLNNISECFNSYIKEVRYKPIITMLEMIRRMIMIRIHEKRVWAMEYTGVVCPRILKKAKEADDNAVNYITCVGGERTFEVRHC